MREKRMLGMIFTMFFLLLITGVRAEAETINYEDGSRYEGTVVNGKRQGFGIFYRELNDENTIEGCLKDVVEGVGLSTDNVRTEGFWYDDVQQGPGIIIIQIEEVELRCEGFWSDGEMSGAFLFRYGNGAIFSNNMQDGLSVILDEEGNILLTALFEGGKESEAELVNWTGDDGVIYYAESKADIVGGKGIAVYQDGRIYIGEFLYGQPEGKGVYYWKADMKWYSGSFHDGVHEGAGVGFYAPGEEGTVYNAYMTGYWEEGRNKGGVVEYKSDGRRLVYRKDEKERDIGVVIYSDGTKKICEWDKNGTASDIEDEVWMDPDGNICAGDRTGDYVDGYGLMIDDDEIYIGYATAGSKEGIGYAYSYSFGNCYEGEWEYGKLNGSVNEYWVDGGSAQATYRTGGRSEIKATLLDGSWYEIKSDSDTGLQGIMVTVTDDGSRDVTVYEDENVQENPGVTIYKDTGYSGRYAVFEPGEYHMADMVRRGISNDSITSITIPEGYSITVYHNDDFSGIRHRYTSDVDFYVTGENDQTRWNDSVSSFIVEKTGQ